MYNLIHNLPRLVSRCAARGGGGEPNYPRLATVLEPEDGLLVGRSTRPIITSGVVATTGKLVPDAVAGLMASQANSSKVELLGTTVGSGSNSSRVQRY